MARFRPFRGIRYSSEAAGAFDNLVAPPYDVISPQRRDALYEKGPYNVTRLILNRDGHAAAGKLFREWIDDSVLVREEAPSFYLYCQEFESDGPKRRTGVIGALRLEPFSTGVVRPHEQTFSHHKKDRLDLTEQARANLSPIFGLYSNPAFAPEPDGGWDSAADVDVTFEGVRNRLWVVRDRANQDRIAAAVEGRTVFIADGHHRYETALNYFDVATSGLSLLDEAVGTSDEAEPAAHVMAFLGAFEDPGMIILPTHRELVASGGADPALFVGELAKEFTIEKVAKSAAGRDRVIATLEAARPDENVLGVALRGDDDYMILRRSFHRNGSGTAVADLDVSVLHSMVLGGALGSSGAHDAELSYSADAGPVFERVDSGASEAGFFMRPMRADEMEDACMAGEVLPQKSTYFYPKLLTGLVFHTLAK